MLAHTLFVFYVLSSTIFLIDISSQFASRLNLVCLQVKIPPKLHQPTQPTHSRHTNPSYKGHQGSFIEEDDTPLQKSRIENVGDYLGADEESTGAVA